VDRRGMECISVRIMTEGDEEDLVRDVLEELKRVADYIQVSKPYPNRRGSGYRIYVTLCRKVRR